MSLKTLQLSYQLGLSQFLFPSIDHPVTVMGLTFPNPIGLAAGLDKNGEYVDALAAIGFGFIEIGTVTPKPQLGNPKPRLFRLPHDEAIINRLGFNNKGVEYVVNQLQKIQYRGILGINIGKNKETPNELAANDYLFCFRHLWPFASYITINISSPNTPNLRDLQQNDLLSQLLEVLKAEQTIIAEKNKKYVPLVVKISPDLSTDALAKISRILLEKKIDGVIATNTTITRDQLHHEKYVNEIGGLSGRPLNTKSTDTIKTLYTHLQNQIPIIASGGVMDEKAASEKLEAGARLLQIYTGFIYHGPKLIAELSNLFPILL